MKGVRREHERQRLALENDMARLSQQAQAREKLWKERLERERGQWEQVRTDTHTHIYTSRLAS